MKLTDKQKQVLNSIKYFINENGYSPTVRELGVMLNLSSTATVHTHLKNLVRLGYITYKPNKMRTIRIIRGE